MLRAFVISGMLQEGDTLRPVTAIYFDNKAPEVKSLVEIGLCNMEMAEATRPAGYDKQPTEPTLYVYGRTPSVKSPSGKKTEILIIRLDEKGVETSRERCEMEPQVAIPKISGMAANKLYPPAYAFMGTIRKDVLTPVSGVLFIEPGSGAEPDLKTFQRLGISIKTIERVSLEGAVRGNMLYMFERPIATSVQEITLKADEKGMLTMDSERTLKGDPGTLIPAVSGGALEWLYRRSGPESARISGKYERISSPAEPQSGRRPSDACQDVPSSRKGIVR
jgi:hypothetical protein